VTHPSDIAGLSERLATFGVKGELAASIIELVASALWFTCEVCEKPIKDNSDCTSSEDGCWFHLSCTEVQP
jgi:hypothetical protein